MVPDIHRVEADTDTISAVQARIRIHRAAIADLRAKGHSSELLDGVLRYLVAARDQHARQRWRALRPIGMSRTKADPQSPGES
ncbi:hypothetical protein [Chelatococcus asaccharovorans]|uniref:Uncharacterized protein n=1 Tax=Chelatococcus asaccharovorans TaxID=28210 RepID=A0A2V3TZV0_9HYPH|nr:hypothetical protein [Chelatococcus asaccharovorans]PXW54677.1 hypothetical protein C7450_111209 [Chelatococcus asaccharovorans]CAH1650084.1 conserved hypothetical protein [Chelatococcus asaccharovorans]CAH1686815.1 conserved hypothetical protein [Chelatococcus asaccharovorans]